MDGELSDMPTSTFSRIASLSHLLKQAEDNIELRNRTLYMIKTEGPSTIRDLFGPVLFDSDLSRSLLKKWENDDILEQNGEDFVMTEVGKKLYFGLNKSGWKYPKP